MKEVIIGKHQGYNMGYLDEARRLGKVYMTEEDYTDTLAVEHIIRQNCIGGLFPEPSIKNWVNNNDNFECILCSLYLTSEAVPIEDINKLPPMVQDFVKVLTKETTPYQLLIDITNHPYSVPLRVIIFCMLSLVMEDVDRDSEKAQDMFNFLAIDTLRNSLGLDSSFQLLIPQKGF